MTVLKGGERGREGSEGEGRGEEGRRGEGQMTGNWGQWKGDSIRVHASKKNTSVKA